MVLWFGVIRTGTNNKQPDQVYILLQYTLTLFRHTQSMNRDVVESGGVLVSRPGSVVPGSSVAICSFGCRRGGHFSSPLQSRRPPTVIFIFPASKLGPHHLPVVLGHVETSGFSHCLSVRGMVAHQQLIRQGLVTYDVIIHER